MKRKVIIAAALIFWLTCGYVAHGYCLGMLTNEFPYEYNNGISIAWSYTFGPAALLFIGAFDGFHHWRSTPLTKEQAWESFHKHWPELTRDDFEESY